MKGYINGINWFEAEPMKYWSFTAGTSDEVKKTTVRNAIFSGDYLGSLKVDGFYERLLKDEDGNCFIIARSRNVKGEVVDKYAWVPQLSEWWDALPNGTCVLSEAYLPGNEGSKNVTSILGCLPGKAISRQMTTPLHFHIFDIMAFNGHNYDKLPYVDRATALTRMSEIEAYQSKYVHYTKFFEGEELWQQLQSYLAEGREGMVIMRKDAIVYNKRTPARVSIKVKKEIKETIDCFFTGKGTAPTKEYTGKEIENWPYWEDQRTGEKLNEKLYVDFMKGRPVVPVTKSYFYGWYGSLEIGVMDGDKVVPIGLLSGITEEMKAAPELFKFRPIEVTAMEIDFSNKIPTLRHGKMIGFRDDINIEDCTLDKFMGSK